MRHVFTIRYFLLQLFLGGLLLLAFGQLSCSRSRSADLQLFSELTRKTAEKLPKETAITLLNQVDSIQKVGVKVSDSAVSAVADALVFQLRKNQAYSALMDYVREVTPILQGLILDEVDRRQALIYLKTYECESYNDLGMFDRATDSYFRMLQEAKTYQLYGMQQLIYNNLGSTYSIQKRYKEALQMHLHSMDINKKHNPKSLSYNYNNIASCYRNLSNFEKAIEYRMMALHEIPLDNQERYMRVKLNLVDDYTRMGEFSMASKNVLPVKAYFEKTQNSNELPITYQRYAEVLWKTGQFAAAKQYYQRAFDMRKWCNYLDRQLITQSYVDFCDSTGDHETEMSLLKYQINLIDEGEFNRVKRSLVTRINQEELEKNNASTVYFRKIISNDRLVIIGLSAFLLLILLVSMRYTRKLKSMTKTAEKERDGMHEQLTRNTIELQRTATALQSVQDDLVSFQKTLLSKTHKETVAELRQLTSKVMRANSGSGATEAIAVANPTFFKALLEKYPKLTPNDLKLCSMLRQGMSSKEIALVTGKEVRSVEVARNRLRHKLALERDQDMVLFLMQF